MTTPVTPEQLAVLAAQWPGGLIGLRIEAAVVPTAMHATVIRSTQGPLLKLEFHTPLGMQHYIYDCDGAIVLGEEIRMKASQAKSGLILPGLG
jgi:hypothetical protein